MKTRGLKDLYLPKGIAKHVKIILFCAAFTPLWGLYINQFSSAFLIGNFCMMIFDIEVVLYIAKKWFKTDEEKVRKFEETHTLKQVTLMNLLVMILFIVVALAVFTLVFALFIISEFFSKMYPNIINI